MASREHSDVVYLLGTPHSGSTLLSLLLGTHPTVFAAGELSSFASDYRSDVPCSCGAVLRSCSFWSHVQLRFGDLRALGGEAPADVRDDDARLSHSWPAHIRLLALVHELAPGRIVLDSSKYASRFRMLNGQIGRVRLIHLVRDGRAVLYSYRRHMRKVTDARGVASLWRTVHEEGVKLSEQLGADYLRVKYEDLTSNHEAELSRIQAWLGIESNDSWRGYESHESHHVRGNPIRMDPRPIKEDTVWKAGVSGSDRSQFDLVAGELIRYFGYA